MGLRRRNFLSAIAAASALLASPPRALAQARPVSRLPRIGLVVAGALPKDGARALEYDGAVRGLAEQGLVDGKSVIIEARYAAGRMHRIEEFVHELVALRVDLLIVAGQQGQVAARRTGRATPAVLVSFDTPETLVAQLPRRFGTTTGIACASGDIAGKRLELLKQMAPAVSRVAVASNPGDANKAIEMERMRGPASALGLSLRGYPIEREDDFATAFAQMERGGMQAVVVLTDPYFLLHAARLAELAAVQRFPAMYGARQFVESGGLLSYGADLTDAFRRAGIYAGRILQGTDPRDLPVEQMPTFELAVNRKAATALGLAIPAALLQRADRVIE